MLFGERRWNNWKNQILYKLFEDRQTGEVLVKMPVKSEDELCDRIIFLRNKVKIIIASRFLKFDKILFILILIKVTLDEQKNRCLPFNFNSGCIGWNRGKIFDRGIFAAD